MLEVLIGNFTRLYPKSLRDRCLGSNKRENPPEQVAKRLTDRAMSIKIVRVVSAVRKLSEGGNASLTMIA